MANNKEFFSRIVHKHDTEANWNKATNFIPLQGEIIIYDIDQNHNYSRVKVGNGATTVTNLPFIIDSPLITTADIDTICSSTISVAAMNGEVKF